MRTHAGPAARTLAMQNHRSEPSEKAMTMSESQTNVTSSDNEPLKFKVAPHLVQDLGLNLYTSLGKVLVEFVANAYDADSPYAHIRMEFDKIKAARDQLRAQWKLE